MNRTVVSIAFGEHYQPLSARLEKSIGEEKLAVWRDTLPLGAPADHEAPILAYCAKPWAMRSAWQAGADLLLWLDAACMAIKPLDTLWDHIAEKGYYCQDNGWNTGEWCADHALATLGVKREEVMVMPEISTMALGLDMRREDCRSFLEEWCRLAADGKTFVGAHTNDIGPAAARGVAYRSVAHVSDDPRVMGHRHDQTAASVLAHRRCWWRTPRPYFVGYASEPTNDSTLILNRGGL